MAGYLIHYFMLLIAGIAVLYLLGALILEGVCFRNYHSAQHSIFLKLVVGVIAAVFFISITATHFVTVNVAFIVIGIFVYLHLKNEGELTGPLRITSIRIFRKEKAKDFIPLFCYAVFWFIWHGVNFFVGLDANLVTVPDEDTLFYANVAGFINFTGHENPCLSYVLINPEYHGVLPYHYFDLWLGGGFAKLFGILPLYGLILFAYPVLLVICSLGLNLMTSLFFRQSVALYIFSPLLIFVTGINPLDLLYSTNPLEHNNPAFFPKYGVVIMFLLCFVLNILRKKKGIIILTPLLCLTLAYSTALPAIVIFYCLVFLFGSWLFSESYRKPGVVLLMFCFGVTLFCILHFFKISAKSAVDLSFNNYLYHPFTPVSIAGKTVLQILVLYFVFLFPLLFVYYNKRRELISVLNSAVVRYMGILTVSSLFSWMLLYPLFDSVQFFTMTGMTSFNLLLIYVLFASIPHCARQLTKVIITLPFLVICLLNLKNYSGNPFNVPAIPVHSKTYLDEIGKLFATINNPIGAFCKAPSDYPNIFRKNSLTSPLGSYVPLFHPHAHQLSMSVFEIPLDTNYYPRQREKLLIEAAPFYSFVQAQKRNNTFHSITASQLDFIRENKIEYLIISDRYQLNDTLRSLVKSEIIDSFSKEHFILLK